MLQAHFQPLWAQEINLTRSQSVALCSSKATTQTTVHWKVCTYFFFRFFLQKLTFPPLTDEPQQNQELPFSIHGHTVNWKIMATIETAIAPSEMKLFFFLFLKQCTSSLEKRTFTLKWCPSAWWLSEIEAIGKLGRGHDLPHIQTVQTQTCPRFRK